MKSRCSYYNQAVFIRIHKIFSSKKVELLTKQIEQLYFEDLP